MKHMSLKEIAAACGGTYYGDEASAVKEVSSVVIDSRKAEKDSLFIAIKGARVDGHTFIPQVMEKGALCAVSEQDLGDVSYPYIRVTSARNVMSLKRKEISTMRSGFLSLYLISAMNTKSRSLRWASAGLAR